MIDKKVYFISRVFYHPIESITCNVCVNMCVCVCMCVTVCALQLPGALTLGQNNINIYHIFEFTSYLGVNWGVTQSTNIFPKKFNTLPLVSAFCMAPHNNEVTD